jgi:hypothetical protein
LTLPLDGRTLDVRGYLDRLFIPPS